MAPTRRPFYLSVSKLAAAAGRNRWQSQEQVLADCYRKEFPTTTSRLNTRISDTPLVLAQEAITNALASKRCAEAEVEENAAKRYRIVNEVATETLETLRPALEVAKEEAQHSREAAVKVADGLRKESQALEKTAENFQAVATELQVATAREEAAKQHEAAVVTLAEDAVPSYVKQEVRSAVETRRGIRDEAGAIAVVPGFEPDGVMTYGSYDCGGYKFRFGGKCDGKETASGDLLEVKNRQRQYQGLPVYEEIQVLAYLYIFNRPRCLFREVLDGVAREDRVILRDDGKLGSLIDEGLVELMQKWDRMQTDEAYCSNVLMSNPAKF